MNLVKIMGFALSALLIVQCGHNRPEFAGKTESEQLDQFFEWSFMTYLRRMPQEMTYLGMDEKQDQLNNHSYEFDQENMALTKEHLRILRTFDRDELSKDEQLSYDLYEKQLSEGLEEFKWRDYRYQVNQMFGIQSGLPGFMINMHRVKTEKDLQNYLSRLKQFKRVFGEVINNLMRSETQGVVPPKFVFPKVIDDSKNIISGNPFVKSRKDSPLFADFKKKLKSLKLSKEKNSSYMSQAENALLTSVGPGFADLITFLEKQQMRATADDGAWKFPKGSAYYQHRLEKMTTTKMNAEQIHNLGLANVKRIHDEMRAIAKKVKFKGDLKAFFKFMNSKKFLLPQSKSGRAKYLKIAKKYISDMEKNLDKIFITKPKAPIIVKAVEAFREKSAGMAFYQNATPDGSRPGTYYVNLYNMKALPKWEAEALAYHEGIPGHHMQISIAQELQKVPKFRRYAHFTSYIEGWGLYSEKLPKEWGFYRDPYSDFGRLSMELTRACRLVVDTGLHSKKWTREQAIKYLDDHLPGDHMDNVRQINRYIVMPGQATAYMIGMLKILELREKARKSLGSKFDIRKFHDVILTSGPVPLDTLESLVDDYIKGA